jgi:hypothetical protein
VSHRRPAHYKQLALTKRFVRRCGGVGRSIEGVDRRLHVGSRAHSSSTLSIDFELGSERLLSAFSRQLDALARYEQGMPAAVGDG